ncbi:MAG TPA: glycosyl hydrolase family 18 protein, partial [Polyangiaceae bacterium]|nr:glycosyl hydrolase family 18 protein [Polyangiaceae bacterium]
SATAGGGAGMAGAGGDEADGGSGGASGSATAGGSAGMAGAGGATSSNAKQVWIWVSMNYKADLDTVIANAKSFTHVSPALYQLQDPYQSGNVPPLNDNDQYDGLSSLQIAQELHAAGLKCVPLMYAGAGNLGGNDAGIQSVLNDSTAQQNFITAAVNEAKTKGYDGWNLDWEVDSGIAYASYGDKFLSFLGAFKQALNQQGMMLTIDLGDWFAQQCGDHSALIDLTQLGPAVDLAIMEDYNTSLGTPGSACPATPPSNINCDRDYAAQLDVMCNVKPRAAVAMGLIAPDSSAFASDALMAVSAYGYRAVALWPGNMGFLAKDNFPADQTWMSVFSDFLATK